MKILFLHTDYIEYEVKEKAIKDAEEVKIKKVKNVLDEVMPLVAELLLVEVLRVNEAVQVAVISLPDLKVVKIQLKREFLTKSLESYSLAELIQH